MYSYLRFDTTARPSLTVLTSLYVFNITVKIVKRRDEVKNDLVLCSVTWPFSILSSFISVIKICKLYYLEKLMWHFINIRAKKISFETLLVALICYWQWLSRYKVIHDFIARVLLSENSESADMNPATQCGSAEADVTVKRVCQQQICTETMLQLHFTSDILPDNVSNDFQNLNKFNEQVGIQYAENELTMILV